MWLIQNNKLVQVVKIYLFNTFFIYLFLHISQNLCKQFFFSSRKISQNYLFSRISYYYFQLIATHRQKKELHTLCMKPESVPFNVWKNYLDFLLNKQPKKKTQEHSWALKLTYYCVDILKNSPKNRQEISHNAYLVLKLNSEKFKVGRLNKKTRVCSSGFRDHHSDAIGTIIMMIHLILCKWII